MYKCLRCGLTENGNHYHWCARCAPKPKPYRQHLTNDKLVEKGFYEEAIRITDAPVVVGEANHHGQPHDIGVYLTGPRVDLSEFWRVFRSLRNNFVRKYIKRNL